MKRLGGARREKTGRVSVAFRLEKLPHRADFHEFCSLFLHFFDILMKFQSGSIALGQELLEITFEAEVSAVKHVRIDVVPNLVEIWNHSHAPVEIGGRRN